ncbi:unnamed protein product [Allacma fusca]|uniref:Uncharacterized protein n=1 Tax=Allacma fusca TaxID=39272 RepID=A0A8J2JW14_9HEXA|nr:unnamed protein product [Allacma fusca]
MEMFDSPREALKTDNRECLDFSRSKNNTRKRPDTGTQIRKSASIPDRCSVYGIHIGRNTNCHQTKSKLLPQNLTQNKKQ